MKCLKYPFKSVVTVLDKFGNAIHREVVTYAQVPDNEQGRALAALEACGDIEEIISEGVEVVTPHDKVKELEARLADVLETIEGIMKIIDKLNIFD